MILRQFLHSDPVGVSYLFGCGGKASGAVVDPVGDIQIYLREAEATGLRIRFVIDTHVHADHLSAGCALAVAASAEYVLWTGADVSYPFKGVVDGEVLPLGNVIATVMHTPGHTPEHISLLVTDRTRGDDPWFVLRATHLWREISAAQSWRWTPNRAQWICFRRRAGSRRFPIIWRFSPELMPAQSAAEA